ncbi:MAG TPA: hypothetical protein VFQ07_15460 [Candidatus Polarisedimenticolia bacterium]|nr:hypothetical protein [Candidatus Polarisedimenticolia bacterium]
MGLGFAGRLGAGLLFTLAPSGLFAQSSASYRIDEKALNEGGRPAQAVVSTSPSYLISLDAIGDPIAGLTMSGPSFHLGGGSLATAFPPPGEVNGLQILADRQTLVWSPEPASAAYNVYAGLLSTLPGPFGACAIARVAGTSAVDVTVPGTGTGLFYLVTGVNGLREEGTKGSTSNGTVRPNPSPCP